MAARLNPAHDQRTRDKIKTSQLVNRLQDFALLAPDDEEGIRKKAMTKEQIAAAKTLLAKTLPNLQSVEHAGEIVQRVVAEKPMDADEWAERHAAGE